jgi:hypothetical protein
VVAGNPKGPNRLKASEVASRPPAAWDVAAWDRSHWDDAVGGVTLDSDGTVDLVGVIKRAVAFLCEQTKEAAKIKRRGR